MAWLHSFPTPRAVICGTKAMRAILSGESETSALATPHTVSAETPPKFESGKVLWKSGALIGLQVAIIGHARIYHPADSF